MILVSSVYKFFRIKVFATPKRSREVDIVTYIPTLFANDIV